jgi:hypothetical protein
MVESGFPLRCLHWRLWKVILLWNECEGITKSKLRLDESTRIISRVLQAKSLWPCKDYLTTILNSSGTLLKGSAKAGDANLRMVLGWSRRSLVSTWGVSINQLPRPCRCPKTKSSADGMSKRALKLIAAYSTSRSSFMARLDSVDGPRRKLVDAFKLELSRAFQVEVIGGDGTKHHRKPWLLALWISTSLRSLLIFSSLATHVVDQRRPHSACRCCGSIPMMLRYLAEPLVCVFDFTFDFNTSTIAYASIVCTHSFQENASSPLRHPCQVLKSTLLEVTGLFLNPRKFAGARYDRELCR